MIFPEKLQILRKAKALTQEELAEKLNISRQAIAKWETGLAFPDISNLIQLSDFFNVTVDYLIKEQKCSVALQKCEVDDICALIDFRLEANRNTYAGFMNEVESTRLDSHDFRFEKGDYVYHDSYVGAEQFAGQEAVWKNGKSVYAMNYCGRVLDQKFSGNFLKEALRAADKNLPFRGPALYKAGEYTYQAKVTGDINWFQGYEEIFCGELLTYECYFHGGMMK